MNKISYLFVAAALLAAAGCKKPSNDCAQAIDHSMELSKADMAKRPGVDARMMAKLRAIGVQRCTEDKWPADVRSCMTAAKTESDSQACYGKLTQDQRDSMNKAATEAMTPAAGAGETGSGSAGSAAAPK